jgi:hypothetical protein
MARIKVLTALKIKQNLKPGMYADGLGLYLKVRPGNSKSWIFRYRTGGRLRDSLAWRHKVNVVHFPLQRLPIRLLERHKSFRFLALTRNQWEEFQRRRSASAAIWSG